MSDGAEDNCEASAIVQPNACSDHPRTLPLGFYERDHGVSRLWAVGCFGGEKVDHARGLAGASIAQTAGSVGASEQARACREGTAGEVRY